MARLLLNLKRLQPSHRSCRYVPRSQTVTRYKARIATSTSVCRFENQRNRLTGKWTTSYGVVASHLSEYVAGAYAARCRPLIYGSDGASSPFGARDKDGSSYPFLVCLGTT